MAPKIGQQSVVTVEDTTPVRPPLVGSMWTRREAAGDDWDTVEICGVFDLGERNGGLELVVRPLTFGHAALTASVESLATHYKRDDGPDETVARVRSSVDRLAAAAGVS